MSASSSAAALLAAHRSNQPRYSVRVGGHIVGYVRRSPYGLWHAYCRSTSIGSYLSARDAVVAVEESAATT